MCTKDGMPIISSPAPLGMEERQRRSGMQPGLPAAGYPGCAERARVQPRSGLWRAESSAGVGHNPVGVGSVFQGLPGWASRLAHPGL
jgi:hypothetical protein